MRAVIGKKEEVAKLTQYTEFHLQGQQASFAPGQYFFVMLKPDDDTPGRTGAAGGSLQLV